MAKCGIKQTTSHDNTVTLVICCQSFFVKYQWGHANRGAKGHVG